MINTGPGSLIFDILTAEGMNSEGLTVRPLKNSSLEIYSTTIFNSLEVYVVELGDSQYILKLYTEDEHADIELGKKIKADYPEIADNIIFPFAHGTISSNKLKSAEGRYHKLDHLHYELMPRAPGMSLVDLAINGEIDDIASLYKNMFYIGDFVGKCHSLEKESNQSADDNSSVKFIHTDLHFQNIFLDGKQVYLIDNSDSYLKKTLNTIRDKDTFLGIQHAITCINSILFMDSDLYLLPYKDIALKSGIYFLIGYLRKTEEVKTLEEARDLLVQIEIDYYSDLLANGPYTKNKKNIICDMLDKFLSDNNLELSNLLQAPDAELDQILENSLFKAISNKEYCLKNEKEAVEYCIYVMMTTHKYFYNQLDYSTGQKPKSDISFDEFLGESFDSDTFEDLYQGLSAPFIEADNMPNFA